VQLELDAGQVRHIIRVLTADQEEAMTVLQRTADHGKAKDLQRDIEMSREAIEDMKRYLKGAE
jgi:predicted RNA-binding protein with PIN domain